MGVESRRQRKVAWCRISVALSLLLAGCGAAKAGEQPTSGHKAVTISWQLNDMASNSPLMKAFNAQISSYEKAHPWVHVKYIETNTNTNTQQAYLVTEAAGGHVPDVTWNQYGEVDAGTVPKGILTNLAKYLNRPNPYVNGNKRWLDLWRSSAVPYMRTPAGAYYLLMGSEVSTGIFYNKADFRTAGITSVPTSWAAWIRDMALLQKHGITPFLFGDGGSSCNGSWYERKFSSELLHSQLAAFDVNHSQVASGLDTVVAIDKGIISMKNPAYAAGWKLLGSIRKYLAPGSASYNPCALLTATTPPLSEVPPFVHGSAAMVWGGSWYIYQLDDSGFKGKYGFFPFPEITGATSKYSAGIDVTGTVGGPNGVGEIAVPTSRADRAMTAYKMHWVINLLQYLYSPQHEGAWVAGESQQSDIPLIKGATPLGAPGLSKLLPKGKVPVTVEGILDSSMGTKPALTGMRLLQAYLGGSVSYSAFAKRWDEVLRSGASTFAKANHLRVSQYLK